MRDKTGRSLYLEGSPRASLLSGMGPSSSAERALVAQGAVSCNSHHLPGCLAKNGGIKLVKNWIGKILQTLT